LLRKGALETSSLKRQVEELRQRSGDSSELVGSSATMSQFRNMLERIAPTNSRILLHGPSGCGKELAARTIHQLSSREKGPFVALNAAAITPETMEIELFGTESEPGQPRKIGALEAAHGGTLYLDEVADMPRDTQNKIMRVLIDQNFSRVGGATRVNVDVRIISSTARNMEMMVADGHFRSDLYHRLAVVPVRVPALSEHRDDIPELVGFFMKQISQSTGLPIRKIGDEAMAVLQSHDWPGNIRQLRNNIERLMILTRGDEEAEITSELLPSEVGMQVPKITSGGGEHLMSMPLRDAREIFERDYLTAQINRFGGNISRTAEFIGMERSALHRKLKALGIG
jgi:two-component system nitrogen regulation response regulator NtrX